MRDSQAEYLTSRIEALLAIVEAAQSTLTALTEHIRRQESRQDRLERAARYMQQRVDLEQYRAETARAKLELLAMPPHIQRANDLSEEK